MISKLPKVLAECSRVFLHPKEVLVNTKKRKMFTCNPCLGLKGLIKKITNRVRERCLPAILLPRILKINARVPQRKLEYSKETVTTEAKEEECAAEPEEDEWVAEPEPGVLMTLISLPTGGNRIKKLRFSEELFDVRGAETWWRENYDKIIELYSVIQSQLPQTPSTHSDDEKAQNSLPSGSTWHDQLGQCFLCSPLGDHKLTARGLRALAAKPSAFLFSSSR